jgi:predicted DNA-binding antitoxin AbrB/MazE fold protein
MIQLLQSYCEKYRFKSRKRSGSALCKRSVGFGFRPVIELKGFQKVYLKPGESKQISIEVPVKELQFLDEKMNWIVKKERTEFWWEILPKICL